MQHHVTASLRGVEFEALVSYEPESRTPTLNTAGHAEEWDIGSISAYVHDWDEFLSWELVSERDTDEAIVLAVCLEKWQSDIEDALRDAFDMGQTTEDPDDDWREIDISI